MMTVQELIKTLKSFSPELKVHCHPVWQYNGKEYTKIYDIESVDDCIRVKHKEEEAYVGIFIR